MTQLDIEPAAAFEIADATRSYESTRPGLGRDFVNHIDAALAITWQSPEMAASISLGIRRVVLHRFPFSIVYRLTDDGIQVLALFPHRADPVPLPATHTGSTGT